MPWNVRSVFHCSCVLLCRHVKVEGLQVISKSRCKLFESCYCICYCFICLALFSSIFLWRLRAPSALMTFAFSINSPGVAASWLSVGSHHWSFRLCCPRSGRVWDLHPDGSRIPRSLDFGWVESFPGWSYDAGHHFTSSSWTACPICRNSRKMIPGWCESVEHKNVRWNIHIIFEGFPDLHVVFMSAFIGNMCVY